MDFAPGAGKCSTAIWAAGRALTYEYRKKFSIAISMKKRIMLLMPERDMVVRRRNKRPRTLFP
jgi:hypothetical protein